MRVERNMEINIPIGPWLRNKKVAAQTTFYNNCPKLFCWKKRVDVKFAGLFSNYFFFDSK